MKRIIILVLLFTLTSCVFDVVEGVGYVPRFRNEQERKEIVLKKEEQRKKKESEKYFNSFNEENRKIEVKNSLQTMDEELTFLLNQKNKINGKTLKKLRKEGFKESSISVIDMLKFGLKVDLNQMTKQYKDFLANKNNMNKNYNLYESLISYHKQYQEIKEQIAKGIYDKNYKYHKLLNSYANIRNEADYLHHAQEKVKGLRHLVQSLDNSINKFSKYSNNIKAYSVKHETNKILGISKKCRNTLEYDILDGLTFKTKSIKKNCVYGLAGALKVVQVLNSGVLAKLDRYGNGISPQNIFIYTRKNLVDDELFGGGNLYYTGNYSYVTILGAAKKVMAFKEVNLKDFYFILK